MDQTTVGLLGAAIGAGGAIIAQVTTSIATSLSTAKRFKWEQTQAIRRERDERRTRFADIKREMFGAFLSRNAALLAVLKGSGADVSNFAQLQERIDEILPEIERLAEEITLLGISLGTECLILHKHALMAAVASLHEAAKGQGAELSFVPGLPDVPASDAISIYGDAIVDCRLTMAAHLSGEEEEETEEDNH